MATAFDSSDEEERYQSQVVQLIKVTKLDLHCQGLAGLGEVFLSGLPGCWFREIKQNLYDDLAFLTDIGITDVIVLVKPVELRFYRTPHLLDAYARQGFTVHQRPCDDGGHPTTYEMMSIIEDVFDMILSGRVVLIHCVCGLGRTGVVAACLLQWLNSNITPLESILIVRQLRGRRAVRTLPQYSFVMDFRENISHVERSVSR